MASEDCELSFVLCATVASGVACAPNFSSHLWRPMTPRTLLVSECNNGEI